MQIKLKYFSKKKDRLKTRQTKEMPQIEVDGEMMEQCANCGNIWDGYAQCNCWQINHYEDEQEADDDSGYETD